MDSSADPDSHMRDPTLDPSRAFFTPWHPGTDGAPFSPEISLDGSSPSLAGRPDEFTLHQGYQVYKEELRSLIFNTTNSGAPTRQASPDVDDGHDELQLAPSLDEEHRRETAEILAVGRRVKYLRNYVDQVAPWVRPSRLPSLMNTPFRPDPANPPSSTCSTATAPLAPS
ncbi:hypothetical protein IMZ48_19465 [Candidatus Bathyarchaeota archaeon]|nr:hypothetical protein [Candidatus Bathyarchaeota archaeon]